MTEAQAFKVLMIDDEADIVDFFRKTFANFKHIQYFSSNRAAAGIEIAKREWPSVILLDLRMPEMNGEEALIELKKLMPQTKFIVMTGWEEGGTEQHVLSLGADAFFPKPIDLEKVVAKVMSFLMVKDKN